MAKVKFLHSVLILVLVGSLLVGCTTPPNERGSNGGQSTAQLQERPQTPTPEASVAKNQEQKLNDRIKQLEEKSKKLESDNNTLKTQVKTLAQENKKLSDSHNQWIVVSIIAWLAAMGAIGSLLYLLFRKANPMRLSQSPKKSQVSEENSVFDQKRKEFDEEINDQINDHINKLYHDLSQEFSTQIHNQFITLEVRLKALQRDLTSNYQDNSPHRNVAPNQRAISPVYQSRPVPINQYSDSSNVGWVETYNKNPDSFLKEVTEVSETEESIEARRLGTSQTAIFEKARRGKGNYGILIREGFNYLVPKANIKINEYNYETVETLFECQGYQSGYSNDFKLVKPAIVSPISSGEKWKLIELGVLQFL